MLRLRTLLVALIVAAVPAPAFAANILFVSDSNTDSNIPMALMADMHTVTTVMMDYPANMALLGDLGDYDAVYWSATGPGSGAEHSNPMVFTNLTSYVMGGG